MNLGRVIARQEGFLGVSYLGSFGGISGRIWNCLGESFGCPGGISVTPLADFLAFGANRGNIKKPGKNNGFSWIFEVWGRLWGSENE